MKKFLVLAVVVMLVLTAGLAIAGVVGTKHDMTSNASGFTNGSSYASAEVCVYCHTPHGANTAFTGAPLWNKADVSAAAAYTPYSGSTTLNAVADTTIGAVTRVCLSCHDGNQSVFATMNPANSGMATVRDDTTKLDAAGVITDANLTLDYNFSNDHPVGITYDDTNDTGLNPGGPLTPASVRLFSGKVECASCHQVHDDTNAPFLTLSNSRSALCVDCHTNK